MLAILILSPHVPTPTERLLTMDSTHYSPYSPPYSPLSPFVADSLAPYASAPHDGYGYASHAESALGYLQNDLFDASYPVRTAEYHPAFVVC